MLRKPVVAAIVALTFIAGIVLGAGGMYYAKIVMPEKKVKMIAEKQQEELNRMVRSGEVVSVYPDQLTMKVENSGENTLEGRELTIKIDERTKVQEGMRLLNKTGEVIDLTKRLKPGQKVDVMERDGRAVTVHWSAKN